MEKDKGNIQKRTAPFGAAQPITMKNSIFSLQYCQNTIVFGMFEIIEKNGKLIRHLLDFPFCG